MLYTISSMAAGARTGTSGSGSAFGASAWSQTSATATGASATTGFGAARGTSFTRPTQYRTLFRSDPLFARLYRLQAAYNPNSDAYRFTYVFYNKKIGAAVPKRPAYIPEDQWVSIWLDCPDPDNLVPWPVQGFRALEERYESQRTIADQLEQRVKLIQAKIREMSLFYATELRGSFEKIRQNRTRIHQEVLAVVEIEELQRGRGRPMSPEELQVLRTLEAVDSDLDHPGKFRDAIAALERRADAEPPPRPAFTVDPKWIAPLVKVVQMDQEAIEGLEKQVKRMRRIISEWEKDVPDRGE
jgi:hypothetical protein